MIIDIDSDRFVKEVIEGNEYAFLFKDLVVVDLGCNVGTFSFWIYKLAREIHAIDMVQENINSLNETIRKNKLGKIKTYCIAIADNSRQRKYNKDPVLGGGESIIQEEGQFITDCITLKQFMDTHKIDYIDVLKIDVEGMEREIIQAGDFPSDKISTIIGEVHYNPKNRGHHQIEDLLIKMGYRYTDLYNHFVARK